MGDTIKTLLACGPLLPCSRRPLIFPETEDPFDPSEDGRRLDTGKGNLEWWYFDFRFGDGSTLVVIFFTKEQMDRKKGLRPLLEVRFKRPGQDPIVDNVDDIPASHFRASRKRCDVRMGGNTVKAVASGNGLTYTLNVVGKKSRIRADLVLTRLAPSWRYGTGEFYFDEERRKLMGWVVPVPRGEVQGTLEVDGQELQVEGLGYHDHNWTNVDLHCIMDAWNWGRIFDEEHTLLYLLARTSRPWGSRQVKMFALAEGNQLVIHKPDELGIQEDDFQQDSPKEQPYPQRVTIHARQGPIHVDAELTRKPGKAGILEKEDLLQEIDLPRWVLELLRIFMNPWYYRIDANMRITVKDPSSSQPTTSEGSAIYEVSAFTGPSRQ